VTLCSYICTILLLCNITLLDSANLVYFSADSLRNFSKGLSELFIHGLINYGMKTRVLYGSHKHWFHGADFVTSILYNHLTSLMSTIAPQNWSHILYLQVNNCWKENKILLCFVIWVC
jgi:hypothetical protein